MDVKPGLIVFIASLAAVIEEKPGVGLRCYVLFNCAAIGRPIGFSEKEKVFCYPIRGKTCGEVAEDPTG